jgi:capsular exopolysaccharide synthesis family protein
MLNKLSWPKSIRASEARPEVSEEPVIDLIEVFRLLQRQRRLIAGILASAICVAALYLVLAPAHYTASSMLLFDVRKNEPFQQQAYGNDAVDSAYVDSQIEVLKSDNIARSVAKSLDLQADPEFVPPPGIMAAVEGILQRLVNAVFGTDETRGNTDQLSRIARKLQANLTIKRVGLTYVVSVDYRSLDPVKAARISNAVTEAYFDSQLQSRYRAAQRANVWLQDRINELKAEAEKTERAVTDYKAKSNVDADGHPLNEQAAADLSSQRRVLLKDLESSAQTYRALHQALLQRVAEFTQQQSFPATEARVVSQAVPPLEKSDPKTLLVLGAASLLGLVGGLGAGFAREHLDSTLRTSGQVQKKLGLECLGILPQLRLGRAAEDAKVRPRWWPPRRRRDNVGSGPDGGLGIIDLHDQRGRPNPRKQVHAGAAGGDGVIATASGRLRFAVDEPFSRFAETIRSLQVAAELAGAAGRRKVIGVTSSLPGEGKSLVAGNLSEMLAASGSKVLLIDSQPRNRGLTQQLAPKAKAGLMRAVAHRAAVEDLIWRDPNTNLEFLPMDPPNTAGKPVGIVFSAIMQSVLASVQDRYDYVIVDLPAVTPVADVKAVSYLIDNFILVIEWGRTSHQVVLDALDAAPLVAEKLLGVVLNNANQAALRKLESSCG